MLRFDRYLLAESRALDLTSGNLVELERTRGDVRSAAALFTSRDGRTLIDVEPASRGRYEIWEQWLPRRAPRNLDATLVSFVEVLDCARHGAPRPFELAAFRKADRDYLRRALAREARVRGWIPIDAELLGVFTRRKSRQWPAWLEDRSLVVFVEAPGLSGDAVLALLMLAQRDSRPHVLVRALATRDQRWPFLSPSSPPTVHEELSRFQSDSEAKADPSETKTADVSVESAARWALMLDELTGGAARSAKTLDLAQVLVAREQTFEARALLSRVSDDNPATVARRAVVDQQISQRTAAITRGWDMVDDFVGVLQICQDIEDEQAALARVGAFLRDRLQASTVAFVAREATGPYVLTRVGSESARVDLAVRSIETGVSIPAAQEEGPVESACPVRHAAEVIGALWCRWSAGTPVATEQATTLLGIAAAAAAPSLRLAIARRSLVSGTANPVPELVGESPAMVALREAILRAAASPFPVVLEGESGSGKELAARAIHARSLRRDKRFCAINCAALVDDLVEAELFGHTRGAFTGASTERAGLFEDADGGTLFLDEAAELGTRVQAKLLRTLQEGELRRLGESSVRRVDVRIVAATNRPLAGEVEAGRFRKDLWYRLDVIRVALPPLRSRLEDVPLLAAHIWRGLAHRTGSKAILSPATIAALGTYDWPGNIRELQNVLASLIVSSKATGLIGPAALPAHVARAAAFQRDLTLTDARRQFDERYVRAALARAGGRIVPAARELGLTRQGLVKLMGRLGIESGIPDNDR
jgi:DNA-binding NtrC family response regulator